MCWRLIAVEKIATKTEVEASWSLDDVEKALRVADAWRAAEARAKAKAGSVT